MRLKRRWVLIFAALALFAALGWSSHARSVSKTTWEYKVVSSRTPTFPEINEIGAEGWELVSVVTVENRIGDVVNVRKEYYFKRAR